MANTDRDFDEADGERPRVTDRRRVGVDGVFDSEVVDPAAEDAPRPVVDTSAEERARAAESKLIEVQQRFDQLRSQLQREADETRQRLARTAEERLQNEKAAFIRELLPVLDNLVLAIDAAASGTGGVEALLAGLQGTRGGFEAALAASGVEPVPGEGAPFDPELHEAVDIKATDADMNDRVTAVYSRGYRIGNRLLRPARVQVGRAAASGSAGGGATH